MADRLGLLGSCRKRCNAASAVLHVSKLNARKRPHNVRCKELAAGRCADDSPVSGTVKKAFVQEGLYFSQANSEHEDPTIQDHSEGYITQVQTRAVIIIEADDPVIGPVCVMPVGMVEISSCIIDPNIVIGTHVVKGQELGYFQFGGSTHCVIFRRDAIKTITARKGDFRKVGETIAIAN